MSTTPTPTQPNDGGPAFPQVPVVTESHGVVPFSSYSSGVDGMSLRVWFAGQALVAVAAIAARGDLDDHELAPTATLAEVVASQCYAIADAMLAAREVKP